LPARRDRLEDRAMLTKAELQRLRSLREKKQREAQGCFIVEGEKVVGELIAAGFPLLEIYATDEWHSPTASGNNPPSLPIVAVTPDEMARISHFPTPSTVLAVGAITRSPLAPDALTHGLTLALDGVQDAGNVGTLLRIADWFGFARVLLSHDSADLFHQKVINASMGSFARVVVHVVNLADALATVPPQVPVIGCDLAGRDVQQLVSTTDAIVVIGSEGRGLSDAVMKRVTDRVTIPRFGGAESLNAAVAAGIVCAQLRRTR
jgi:RNA methyltransferase, TrmH family